MTLVISQTFTSPSRTEVQGIMCEEEPWHVLRINHIMGERKPKKLSCFFPFLSHPVLGHCSCVDHKLPSTCRERKMRAWSNTWNTLQSCSCVCGVIDDLLQRRGCALWTSCTFLHQSEFDLQLFKIGFYEFRWAECLFMWFVIIYLWLCNDWVASLNSDL